MTDERLALLRELEIADRAAATELAEVDALYAAVEEVRRRALELAELLASLPERQVAAAETAREAELGLVDAQVAAEEAAAALVRAGEDELPEARRRELTARDSLHVAERLAAEARAAVAELQARAEAADAETGALEARAGELAGGLARRARLSEEAAGVPGSGPTGVAEWGTRARAALLVARSQAGAERDAVVRQSHELAAVVLGEPLPPLGTHEVVRRVETELAG